jgi:hypothetical protein
MNKTRLFVFIETWVFAAAALTHFGLLVDGYKPPAGGHGRERHCHRASRRLDIDIDSPVLDTSH